MSSKNPFEGFDPQQMLEQSREFWENWRKQMAQLAQSAGAPSRMNNPWNVGNPFGSFGGGNAFGQMPDPFGFASAFQPRNPMQDAMDQMNSTSAQWMSKMSELASHFIDQTPSSADVRKQWESMFGGAGQDGFNQMFNVMQNAGHQDFSAWLDQVQPFLATFRISPDSSLDVPAFGLMREHQERWQQLTKWVEEYREAAGKFAMLLGEINRDAMGQFEKNLEDRRLQGKVIDSTRALFDVWVDAAETAYEKTALSEDYRKAYGEMVNAQMRVRLAVQNEIERVTAAIGIPGRSEIDAAYRKITQLDREVRRLRDAMMERAGDAMSSSFDSVASFVDEVAAPSKKKKAKKKAAAKKAAKKATRAAAKKATKKVAKKAAAKKAAKKVTRNVAKKATKKVAKRKGR